MRNRYRDRYGVNHKAGDEADYLDHIAVKLIRLGIAVPVRESEIETTAIEPPEKTAPPMRKRRRVRRTTE